MGKHYFWFKNKILGNILFYGCYEK